MTIADEIRKLVGDAGGGGETHQATVLRTDNDGTTWVSIPGGADETPIHGSLVEAEPGDTVSVIIANGRATMEGNATSPAATGRTVRAVRAEALDAADEARATAGKAVDAAQGAKVAAAEAQEVAEAVSQHFWQRSTDPNSDGAGTGAFVTDDTQDAFLEAAADGFSDYDATTKPYNNLLLNSLGMLIRSALRNLVSITHSAVAFFDGSGDAASNVTASFGPNGAQIGKSSDKHVSITTARGLDLYDEEGTSVARFDSSEGRIGAEDSVKVVIGEGSFKVIDSGNTPVVNMGSQNMYEGGLAKIRFASTGNGVKTVFSPKTTIDSSSGILYCRYTDETGGDIEFPAITGDHEFTFSTPPQSRPFEIGYYTSDIDYYVSIGTRPSGTSRGIRSISLGYMSAAEVTDSIAIGDHARAKAIDSIAIGLYSQASSPAQTAIGKYNIEDTNNTYALIVGNGTSTGNRSNALTVDWAGEVATADPTIDRDGAHASADKWHTVHKVLDADGDTIEEMRVVRRASGRMEALWSVYNDKNGATVENTVRIGVDEDGTNVVGLSSGAAWRKAIGAQASIAETTVNVSSVSIPANGQALVQGTAPSGKTACIGCYFDLTSATSVVVLASAPVHYGTNWRTRLMNYSSSANTVSGTMHYFWV